MLDFQPDMARRTGLPPSTKMGAMGELPLQPRLPDFEAPSGRLALDLHLFDIELSKSISGLSTMGSPKIGIAGASKRVFEAIIGDGPPFARWASAAARLAMADKSCSWF